MNQKELKELIEFIIEKDIAEFELERGDVKVKIKRALGSPAVAFPDTRYVAVPPAPVQAVVSAARAPGLDLPPRRLPPRRSRKKNFHIVQVADCRHVLRIAFARLSALRQSGRHLEVGQVLCIVEAMKLMNEIECDVAGELVKKLVGNGQPIEYGQDLFAVRPCKIALSCQRSGLRLSLLGKSDPTQAVFLTGLTADG